MQYTDCVKYMLQIPFFARKNGLENIRELMNRLNNPQDKLQVIHVAGTNGKGSVSTFIGNIYKRAHYKVGLYTSPHLVEINERIKINNHNISHSDFALYFNQVNNQIEQMVTEGFDHPTFFEMIFAMSVLYFVDQKVDIAIIETGIGGRLDTTNIIQKPIACVITKISLDHTSILGDTLDAIAKEKAGIVKTGCPVIITHQKESVNHVFKTVCDEKQVELYQTNKISHKISRNTFKTIDFSVNTKYYGDIGLHLNTGVLYQVDNCLLAIAVIENLRKLYRVSMQDIISGVNDFYWPGRMEIIDDQCILDGSHNLDGIQQFVTYINMYFEKTPIDLLFTVMNNKDYTAIIKQLCTLNNINRVIITRTDIQKNADSHILEQEFRKNNVNAVEIEENIERAFLSNYNKMKGNLFCCVGSLYLVGEVKKIISGGL
jgi:dihydrofolate synthase/folylpolyglutamate synthase